MELNCAGVKPGRPGPLWRAGQPSCRGAAEGGWRPALCHDRPPGGPHPGGV